MTFAAGTFNFKRTIMLAGTLCALVAGLIAAPTASAGKFSTGFAATEISGGLFTSSSAAVRDLWSRRASDAGAQYVRINVRWRDVAPASRPAHPASPGAYDLAGIDNAVRSVVARGLTPVLMPFAAPNWAEQGSRPAGVQPGAWNPRPRDFKQFSKALASRYDGKHGVPRVRFFQGWVEPNLARYLAPQWKNNRRIISASLYVRLLRAFYKGIKGVDRRNVVMTAGTAPFGDTPGFGNGHRSRPLQFWLEAFCLDRRLRKERKGCVGKAPFDVLAHHPINRDSPPRRSARHRDDILVPDLQKLTRALRAAERRGTVAGKRRHRLWVSEFWIETRPPDRKGIPINKHARWLAETLYLIEQQGYDAAILLQIQDSEYDPNDPFFFSVQSGLWFHPTVKGGKRKIKAFKAFRFPFVADRMNRNRVKIWGRAPRSGRVAIQHQTRKGWRTAKRGRAKAGRTFGANLRFRGKKKLRARMRGVESLPWIQR